MVIDMKVIFIAIENMVKVFIILIMEMYTMGKTLKRLKKLFFKIIIKTKKNSEWINDQKIGRGKFNFADGEEYIGEFLK
jgi:hypothetical protein